MSPSKPHLWRMVSQNGKECRWECHCGCGAKKTTFDGNG